MLPTTRTLLTTVWTALGGEPTDLDHLTITGEQPGLLPSSLPALPAMVAAVSASTLAAAHLQAARRGGEPGPVRVDARHVALAARSEQYATGPGMATNGFFTPLSRFWRTEDGWIRLHTNYPWHQERALQVLGCNESQVGDVIAQWPGEALEDALAAAGALGFVVRAPDQWQEHPQGRAIAHLPVLDWTPAGYPTAARREPADAPAAGVRVLDLTRVIAGPVATRTLAAWGAEVLRIDSPRLPEITAQTLDTLPGKHSALVDFATADGRRQLDELLNSADVVVLGYRPGALAAYGLGPEELADSHPGLNVISLCAWGHEGPWAGRRGFDSLVQCATGIAVQEGVAAAESAGHSAGAADPGTLPAQVLDHGTGYLAAAAALLALADTARGGPARHVRLSLAQTAGWLQSPGTGRPEGRVTVDPAPYLTRIPGPDGEVQVIAPPGEIGSTGGITTSRPAWTSTTVVGADPATWNATRE